MEEVLSVILLVFESILFIAPPGFCYVATPTTPWVIPDPQEVLIELEDKGLMMRAFGEEGARDELIIKLISSQGNQ